ncbi:MAG TPA: SdrD B-like domain-containing protein [Solirubrobacter sp.]|nr:SdrD B-like domain-containing protein [Solirubrobacter sp.]
MTDIDAHLTGGRTRSWRRALCGASALAATFALGAPAAYAGQTIDVSVSHVTGTAPFDAAAGPGNDTSATDGIVRSNDTVTHQIQFNVNDTDAGSSTAHNVTIEDTLPAGMKWTRLPATCRTTGVTPPSSISADGRTITCNVGDVGTGQSHTIALTANVTEMENGAVLTPDRGSVKIEADGAPAASTTPPAVTVSSIPRVDMVKAGPSVTETTYGGVPGYFLRYPVRMEIPSFGGRGLVGYEPPAAHMTLKENFSGVSPNAQFVSCGPDSGGTWVCPAAGSASPLAVDVTVADPDKITSGTLSSTTVTIFVPRSDVVAAGGSLQTNNRIEDLVASDGHGTPATGEIPANNSARIVISLDPGSGFGVFKHYVDVTASSRYVPGGARVDRNGFSTVSPNQIFQGEVRVSASNPAAGYASVAACDVFDSTTQLVTLAGPASSASYGKGRPVWITTNSAGLTEGTDFVIEYSSDATSTNADDATRWGELRATGCAGGTWTATAPATEVAANAVRKVRVRFLTTPPRQYTLTFAVNLAAKPGADATKIANFATYDVGAGWVRPSYDPADHTGSLGDRLLLTGVQLTLAKDILDPATAPGGTPSVRGGEDMRFGLRPQVRVPSQTTTPTVVTARDVTVTDILPAGTSLSTVAGHEPSPAPASVTVNPDGTTMLVWNLGTLTSDDTPSLTYWATISPTATGAKVNRALVTSPDDVGSPADVPSSGTDPHYAARTVTVDSLGGIQIDKAIDKRIIEPLDTLTFSVTYANLDLVARDDMDVIDVLPFNGDGTRSGTVPGRHPGSDFHGTLTLRSVDVRDGETVRYTGADPAAVYALYDPSETSPGYDALPAGEAWCTEAQITAGDAGCPASVAAATAIRVTRTGPLAAAANRTFSYTIATHGNRSGDVYANTAALRSSSLLLGTLSPTRDARVVASRIGDFVWNDLDRDGLQGAGEPGVPGVRVVLDGVDKYGNAIHVTTTTGADGRYLFTSSSQAGQDAGVLDLVSGRYHVTFDPSTLPPRASFTVQNAGDDARDSDANVVTGRSDDIVLPDPTPTGTDGEDLTLDAGIVIAPEPPALVPPPPAPEGAVAPAEVTSGMPALKVTKTSNRAAVRPGQTIRYTLTVRNTGTAAATRVQLCDVLPDHLTVVTTKKQLAKTKGKVSRGRVCWTVGTLRAGGRVTRTLTVRVDGDARAGKLVNRATADSAEVPGVDARARRTVKVRPAEARRETSRVTG